MSQESFSFLQEDLRNPPKQGSSDSASLPQGSFPQAEPLDWEDKAALPPLGNSSFMYRARPDSWTFQPSSTRKIWFSLQILLPLRGLTPCSREGSSDSHRLSLLKHVGVQIPGFPIVEEASPTPLSFLSLLEAVVRSYWHFNVVIARRLVNLMAGTTLEHRDCILKSVLPALRTWLRIFPSKRVSRPWQLPPNSWLNPPLSPSRSLPFRERELLKSPRAESQPQGEPNPQSPWVMALRPSSNLPLSPSKGPLLHLETKVPSLLQENLLPWNLFKGRFRK